jgi:GT2 family glycosyltransferase
MKNILVIPFYKNENYIDNFVKYFSSYQSEYDLFEKICIFNDCPDSPGTTYLKEQCALAKFEYIPNEINLGFLKTANRGFAIAKDFGANLVILNSDTLPHKNAFYELLKCFETDSMIGCVAPRSNNATICNLFSEAIYVDSNAGISEIIEIFEESKKYVPKLSYTPVTNGFCIAIKHNVIRAFKGYSEEFNPGYEEENEFCLRVASHGLRIAIANHSFIAHLEGKSFGLNPGRNELRDKNHENLLKMYPNYYGYLQNYNNEYETKAYQFILKGLRQGTKSIAVDASNLGDYHNGTNKLIIESIRALSSIGHEISVLANKSAFEFHGLNNLKCVSRVDQLDDKKYKHGIRIGQPFNHGSLVTIPSCSIFAINIFFDSIALDCPQIYIENPEIYGIWSKVGMLFSSISFISNHSYEQFKLRLRGQGKNGFFNLIPANIDKITKATEDVNTQGNYALIFGNKFKHKGLEVTLKELPRKIGFYYIVLGDKELFTERNDIKVIQSGNLSDDEIRGLIYGSRFIIIPSFSEGYGYPLVEALSYGKNVYLRNIDCYKEIVKILDKNLEGLIHFVDDFSVLECSHKEIENFNNTNSNYGYVDYINQIIQDAEAPKEFIFDNLCKRMQYLDLMKHDDNLKRYLKNKVYSRYQHIKRLRMARPFIKIIKKYLKK